MLHPNTFHEKKKKLDRKKFERELSYRDETSYQELNNQ